MVGELLHHADQDVELAQRGIVFIDEIDKIARRSQGARTGAGLARHRRRGRAAGRCSSCSRGARSSRRSTSPSTGTSTTSSSSTRRTSCSSPPARSPTCSLHRRGQARRLRRRPASAEARAAAAASPRRSCSTTASWPSSSAACPCASSSSRCPRTICYLIMTGPPDAVVREYQALLEDGRRRPALLRRGAARRSRASASAARTGARSLRTIVEEICHDVMFEAPERKGETVDHRARDAARAPRAPGRRRRQGRHERRR